ncbi:MAG: hypothetical protein R2749_04260 [Acidimicrobiales bacterium]
MTRRSAPRPVPGVCGDTPHTAGPPAMTAPMIVSLAKYRRSTSATDSRDQASSRRMPWPRRSANRAIAGAGPGLLRQLHHQPRHRGGVGQEPSVGVDLVGQRHRQRGERALDIVELQHRLVAHHDWATMVSSRSR